MRKCIQPYDYVQSIYFSLILNFQPGKFVGDFLPDLWQDSWPARSPAGSGFPAGTQIP